MEDKKEKLKKYWNEYKKRRRKKDNSKRYRENHKEEIKKAFSPDNHQWLLASENLSKGSKWDGIVNL